MIYAYLARFLSISLQTVESGLARVTPNMEAAARSLGCSAGTTLWRVHLPLLRGSLFTAALLVFIDVMKELPATLVMRPFNFNTLATLVYEDASRAKVEDAGVPAIIIVAVGLIPVFLVSRSLDRKSG